MNAHINHDLPLALLDLWDKVDREAHDSPAFLTDYDEINTILAGQIDREKQSLDSHCIADIDDCTGKVDDVVASWSLDDARTHAWESARMLWHLRELKLATDALEDMLDRLVGSIGAGLLTPLS